ncbi:flagellar hook protein FlgE [Geosporobacter ferrireducens]|uniref:flagellar hook protein FlgE n=1 Tax=Geosporobacter ferrireducens TaxID=1424294 RepID=UPI00139B8D75|nr:flagellar hook protein FlgE [Geosporobacter ferrireducens]MTI57302.1 flagellar hook protein FlgE [Geosporobacter ferrireducens]
MMRSMYSAVSGLRVHQTKMDVIGNNIANVNTVGFKASKVTFQEVFSQVIKGASSPQGGMGGTNPQQIGLGASIASMNVRHTQGAAQRTNYPLDVMIDGSGFFVVTDDVNLQNRYYTRAGAFTLDKQGNLIDPNGYKVLGYDENNAIVPVQVNFSATATATATANRYTANPANPAADKSAIQLKGNINFDDAEYATTIDVFDSLGRVHTVSVTFTDNLVGNTGGTDPQVFSYRKVQFGEDPANVAYVKFDAQGNYVGLVESVAIGANDLIAETNPNITIGFSLKNIPGADDITFTINDSTFQDDNGNALLTQFAGESDAKGVLMVGNSAGVLDDFTISDKGEVVGIFTNGERKVLATLMLADFDNAPGLQKIGNNLFMDTINSGTPKLGKPGSGSLGALAPGTLEMSNVDLSEEFVDMITTQRGFQANSRMITTTDEMLQELVNLKR